MLPKVLQTILAQKAGGHVYHAAQLRDLRTYVALGRVASRAELFERGTQEYTPFDSDRDDVSNLNCANDVFANLLDQGNFMKSGHGIPNVYGPITLVFFSTALSNSGGSEVKVRAKAIWSYSIEGRRILETTAEIADLYRSDGYARSGEIQMIGGALYLADLRYVLVDPIVVSETRLSDVITAILQNVTLRNGSTVRVYERTQKPEQAGWPIYRHLVTWAQGANTHHGATNSLPSIVSEWFDALKISGKASNLSRFARYLDHGTLSALKGDAKAASPSESAANIDEETEPYDFGPRADSFELSDEQIADIDLALVEMETADFRLRQSFLACQAGLDSNLALELSKDAFLEALAELNALIERLRESIQNRIDDFASTTPDAHGTETFDAMTYWLNQYDDLEIPDDENDVEALLNVDWNSVYEYATFSPHL